ncbi:hypothetical protein TNCV_3676451 [Trichonephila clavipes]|nr:hypothetical protein TNCV_3676451 [Trichonephila clavipes]
MLNFNIATPIHTDNPRAITTCWSAFRKNLKNEIKLFDHGESSIDLRVKVLGIIGDSMVDAAVVNQIIDSTIKALDRMVQGIVLSGVRMIETDI